MRRTKIGFQPSSEINSRRDAAEYIATIALNLRNLAKVQKMSAIQGLFEVVYYEAFSIANEVANPNKRTQRLNRQAELSEVC